MPKRRSVSAEHDSRSSKLSEDGFKLLQTFVKENYKYATGVRSVRTETIITQFIEHNTDVGATLDPSAASANGLLVRKAFGALVQAGEWGGPDLPRTVVSDKQRVWEDVAAVDDV